MGVNLPVAPAAYSATDQSALRAEITRLFGQSWQSGSDLTLLRGEKLYETFDNNLVATTGGLQLNSRYNFVSTTPAGGAVVLWPALAGLSQTVSNWGANPLTVRPYGTDNINGQSSFTQIVYTSLTFNCAKDGTWVAEQGGWMSADGDLYVPGTIYGSGGRVSLGNDGTHGILQFNANSYWLYNNADYSLSWVANGITRMTIAGNGHVGIGTTTPANLLAVYTKTEVAAAETIGDGQASAFFATCYGAVNSYLIARKAGGTMAAPAALVHNDQAGAVNFQAYDGTDFQNVISIVGSVNQVTGANNISADLIFYTRPDGAGAAMAERMRIDKNGRVGINSPTPQNQLEVYNAAGAGTVAVIGDGQAAAFYAQSFGGVGLAGNLFITKARGSRAAAAATPSGEYLGAVGFQGHDGAQFQLVSTIQSYVDTTTGPNNQSGYLTFSTRNDGANAPLQSWLKINKVGQSLFNNSVFIYDTQNAGTVLSLNCNASSNIGVNVAMMGTGTTTPNKYLRAIGGFFQIMSSDYSRVLIEVSDGGNLTCTGVLSVTNTIILNGAAGSGRNIYGMTAGVPRWDTVLGTADAETGSSVGSDYAVYRYADNGTTLDSPFWIKRNTGVATFSQPIVNPSDSRGKRDVRPLKAALGLVGRLKGVSYIQGDVKQRQFGFVAQDMAKVLPDIVFEGVDEDRTQGIAYTNLIAVLVEAVKELTARVETLEAQAG